MIIQFLLVQINQGKRVYKQCMKDFYLPPINSNNIRYVSSKTIVTNSVIKYIEEYLKKYIIDNYKENTLWVYQGRREALRLSMEDKRQRMVISSF